MGVIAETNGFWQKLMNDKELAKDVNTMNTSQSNSSRFATLVSPFQINKLLITYFSMIL